MSLTLMTGAPGWLGTRLVQALLFGLPDIPLLSRPDRTRRIRCLVQPDVVKTAGAELSADVEVVEGDLRNPDAAFALCRKAEGATLFHCAGLVHPTRWTSEFYDINVAGTRHLLAAAEKAGVRRVVAISSNSPFGFNPRRDHLFDEASPYRPYRAYGRSKMLLEQIVREFQSRGQLEAVVLRPPWFYGPGQPARQTEFFRMIRQGRFPILGNGENRRSMAFIDNTCQAALLAEQSPSANGQTFWVADGRPYAMNEVVNTVKRLMATEFGLKVADRSMHLPSLVGDMARWGDALIQGTGLYVQKVHVLSEMNQTIACSIAHAEKELGYQPQIALEEGMRRSLCWCLEKGIPL